MGSMEEGQHYCLKWNDFRTHLSLAFHEMREEEDFFDITLVTDEAEVQCHKLLLAACSPHFK